MRLPRALVTVALVLFISLVGFAASQDKVPAAKPAPARTAKPAPVSAADARMERIKGDLAREIDGMKDLTQQMVDSLFSFAEPGFQEFETKKYCTGILRSHGFTIEENVAGMPTGWTARWGSGKPVIALGSDVDSLLGTSQQPGVPYQKPFIEGAPGHGEGHNSGQVVNIVAALAVKRAMEREHLTGTIRIWPGVAEAMVITAEV